MSLDNPKSKIQCKASRRENPKSNGFTLIELLVVVTIVAVLAAILLPALTEARSQARITQCLANLRGIGRMVSLYHNDNNDFFPPYLYGPNGCEYPFFEFGGKQGAAAKSKPAQERSLYPYTEQRYEIFRCPNELKTNMVAPAFIIYGNSYTQYNPHWNGAEYRGIGCRDIYGPHIGGCTPWKVSQDIPGGPGSNLAVGPSRKICYFEYDLWQIFYSGIPGINWHGRSVSNILLCDGATQSFYLPLGISSDVKPFVW